MPTAVALMMLLAWLYAVYRFGRYLYHNPSPKPPGTGRQAPPVDINRLDLARLRRDMALALSHDSPPPELGELPPDDAAPAPSPEEERESDLTRQLLAGTMSASEYQHLMGDLAHHRTSSAGSQ